MSRTKQDQLDQIAAEIVKSNICPELAAQASRLVMGSGNPDADAVFIGEAPGKNEDETGMPFVGASGRALDELLDSINLSREDIYITNIVKYRPPNNRDPEPAEKEAFLPFLEQQLAVIEPKLIVTLGKHSLTTLIPGSEIREVHGTIQVWKDIKVLSLYHPAAAIYNRKLRPTLFTDIAAIPEHLT